MIDRPNGIWDLGYVLSDLEMQLTNDLSPYKFAVTSSRTHVLTAYKLPVSYTHLTLPTKRIV